MRIWPIFTASSEAHFAQNCAATIKSVGTVTGRVGAAFDRTLLYVLGGYAWEHAGLENPETAFGVNSFASETGSGWTLGVGPEYALTRNWSAFLQYNYMGFGTRDLLFVRIPAAVGNETEVFARASTWSKSRLTIDSIDDGR